MTTVNLGAPQPPESLAMPPGTGLPNLTSNTMKYASYGAAFGGIGAGAGAAFGFIKGLIDNRKQKKDMLLKDYLAQRKYSQQAEQFNMEAGSMADANAAGTGYFTNMYSAKKGGILSMQQGSKTQRWSPFEQAFADARRAGLKVFEFNNKMYTTELSGDPDFYNKLRGKTAPAPGNDSPAAVKKEQAPKGEPSAARSRKPGELTNEEIMALQAAYRNTPEWYAKSSGRAEVTDSPIDMILFGLAGGAKNMAVKSMAAHQGEKVAAKAIADQTAKVVARSLAGKVEGTAARAIGEKIKTQVVKELGTGTSKAVAKTASKKADDLVPAIREAQYAIKKVVDMVQSSKPARRGMVPELAKQDKVPAKIGQQVEQGTTEFIQRVPASAQVAGSSYIASKDGNPSVDLSVGKFGGAGAGAEGNPADQEQVTWTDFRTPFEGDSFNQAFAAARRNKLKVFPFNGKTYTTELAPDSLYDSSKGNLRERLRLRTLMDENNDVIDDSTRVEPEMGQPFVTEIDRGKRKVYFSNGGALVNTAPATKMIKGGEFMKNEQLPRNVINLVFHLGIDVSKLMDKEEKKENTEKKTP